MKSYRRLPDCNIGIKELVPSERPRERLCENGPDSLSDLDLLTIVIGTGSSKMPVRPTAARVLELFDQTTGEKELTVTDLQTVVGIGTAKAAVICAALELARRRLPQKRRQIVFPKDVFPLIRHFGSRSQEHFICISLNGAHEVISIQVVSIGLVNHTLVGKREVFSDPIRERATAVIVAHNHPSGNLNPSPDDINVTLRLKKAGDLLGIKVLDHLIFSEDNFRSMLEENELN